MGIISKSKKTEQDALSLERKLLDYNKEKCEEYSYDKFVLKINDKLNNIIAGICCIIGNNWLYVESLWVEESYRKQGLGIKLLRKAEDIAKSKKCIGSYLYTYGFQSPKFYKNLGYKEFGRIENFGCDRRYYLMKKFV